MSEATVVVTLQSLVALGAERDAWIHRALVAEKYITEGGLEQDFYQYSAMAANEASARMAARAAERDSPTGTFKKPPGPPNPPKPDRPREFA